MAGKVELVVVAQNQASAVLKGIGGDIASLGKQAQSVSAGMQSMGKTMTFVGAGLTAGVTAPIAGLAMSAIKSAGDMEQLDIAFTTMLGSADAAKALLADLAKFSAATPFELPEVVAAGRQLLAFGIEAKDIEPTLKQLGDVAAGVGAPIGDLAYLFGTASASGRLMTVDINQFAGRGIPIIEALGKVMGVSASEVRDLAAEGKIGAEEMKKAFAVMTSEGGKFTGLMAAQSQSVQGLFSTVKDNIGQTLTVIGNQIIETFNLKALLGGGISYLEQLRLQITAFAETNPQLFKMGVILATVAAAIGPIVTGLGMAAVAIGAAMPVIATVGAALAGLAVPFAIAAGAAAALYYDVGGVRTAIMDLASGVMSAMPTIQTMASDTFAALRWLWQGKGDNIDWWWDITDGLVSLGIVSQETGDAIAENLFGAGVAIDQIQTKVFDGWLAIKDSVSVAVANFSWSDFIDSLTWENIVNTTIDWATYIAPLAWDAVVTVVDWAAYIGQLAWDNAIIPALEWAAYVAPLAWDAIVTTLGDWGTYVTSLDWAAYVNTAIDWAAYIAPLAWDTVVAHLVDWGAYVKGFSWAAYISPLAWDMVVAKMVDWGVYIKGLDWTSIITTAIDWATWIPALSWTALITSLEWSVYVTAFAWSAFVSVLDWATVAGEGIDWSAFVNALTWDNVVKAITWADYIASFAWGSFITKLEWTGVIAKLDNWASYIPTLSWDSVMGAAIDWGAYIKALDWKAIITTSIDWATWIIALPWNAFVLALDWTAFISYFAWTSYISQLDWSTVATTLTWESFVTALGDWSTYVITLPWSDYIDALGDWGQFIAAVTWNSFIANVNWPSFISMINWSALIPSFSWSAFIPRFDWPSLPSFPGWAALAQGLFGSGGGAAQTAPPTQTAPPAQSDSAWYNPFSWTHRAIGDSNWRGGITWVGETGPELVSLPARSRIYSNAESMAMAGAGGNTFNVNVYATVDNQIDVETMAYRVADVIRRRR